MGVGFSVRFYCWFRCFPGFGLRGGGWCNSAIAVELPETFESSWGWYNMASCGCVVCSSILCFGFCCNIGLC